MMAAPAPAIIRTDACSTSFSRGAPVVNPPSTGARGGDTLRALFMEIGTLADPNDKQAARRELNAQVDAFLAKGGKVRHVPATASVLWPPSIPDPVMRQRAVDFMAVGKWGWGKPRAMADVAKRDQKRLGEMIALRYSRAAICRTLGLPICDWHKVVARAVRAGIVLPKYLTCEVL